MMKCIAAVLLCFTVAVIATDLPDCPQADVYGCVKWKGAGYCEPSSLYYKFVSGNCGAACGICKALPPTLPPPTPPPPPPPPPEIVDVDITACLEAHNAKRSLHNTPALSWDSTMATEAAQYALELATANSFNHSKGDYGENLDKSGTTGSQVSSCEAAVETWYSEIKDYDYNNPVFSLDTGHFTQVIWKSSTKVGVGMATATHNGFFNTIVVARYTPRGNTKGQFEANVLPLA